MADRSEFVDYLLDLMKSLGDVSARRMFGGYGIFRDGLMFGLVADDQLFIKADDICRQEFESLELPPFEYNKQGKLMKLSYYLTPVWKRLI